MHGHSETGIGHGRNHLSDVKERNGDGVQGSLSKEAILELTQEQ